MVSFAAHDDVQYSLGYSDRNHGFSPPDPKDTLSATTPRTPSRGRRNSHRLETTRSNFSVFEFMDAEDEDADVSRFRGFLFLGALWLSVALFSLGVLLPLLEVTAFPGSSMELVITKSLKDAIISKWKEDKGAGSACCLFIAVLPIIEFIGTSIIIFDNFFAKGCECCDNILGNGLLSRDSRNYIVDAMSMMCSYHVVSCFIAILFLGFFSSGATIATCGFGFYSYCAFCFLTIAMLQCMEALKEPPEEEGDGRDSVMGSAMSTKSWQGKRRRLSSFFPELPGLSGRINDVDSWQIFMLSGVFVCLTIASLDEPLFLMHVTFEGFVFQKKELTLRELCGSAAQHSPFAAYLFMLLVFGIPFLYCLLLVVTAIMSLTCWQSMLHRPLSSRYHDGALWLASLLRPWAMTDVFAMCLFLYAFSAQVDEVLVTSLPGGVLQWPSLIGQESRKDKDGRIILLNGSYLFVGAGIAMFFLRWFWQQGMKIVEEGEEKRRSRHYTGFDLTTNYHGLSELHASTPSRERAGTDIMGTEWADGKKRTPTQTRWKLPLTMLLWIVICVCMSLMPYPLEVFSESKVNKLFRKYLPKMNHMAREKLPASLGSCDHSTQVPTPCKEQGKLYSTVQDAKRIGIHWITGLNTLKITDIHVREHEAASSEVGTNDNTTRRKLEDDRRTELEAMTKGDLIKKAVAVGEAGSLLAKAAAGTKEDIIELILRTEELEAMTKGDLIKEAVAVGSKGSLLAKAAAGTKEDIIELILRTEADKEKQHKIEHVSETEEERKEDVVVSDTSSTRKVSDTSSTQVATSSTQAATSTTTRTTTIVPITVQTSSPVADAHPRYSFIVAGEFEIFRLYLKVELCDSCPTKDSCSGCQVLVASNDTCCEPHRTFRIEISLHCDDKGVPSISVHKFHVDSLVVSADADLVDDSQKQLVVSLPAQDITGQVRDTVKSQLNKYLTKEKLVKWGSDELNLPQLLQRVLRFSREDHLFQC